MKRCFFSILVLGAAIGWFALAGCENPTDNGENKNPQTESDYDVYIAGIYFTDNSGKPCYWKNGMKVDLTLPVGMTNGSAQKIALHGENVYVLGSVDNGGENISCYWENGQYSSIQGIGQDIAISNTGDVYIVGEYFTEDESIACYWKNGIKTNLAIGTGGYSGIARAITISDNNVYIVGEYDHLLDDGRGGNWTACYWMNGSRVDLINQTPSHPVDIVVIGNIVYIAGYQYEMGIDMRKALYWRNSTLNLLPIAQLSSSSASGIAVFGNDVYISGYYKNGTKNQACYWKNNVLHDLDDGRTGMDSYALAVTVADSDIYFLGMNCYWQNNNKTDIVNGIAFDMAVVARNQ